MIVKYKDSPNSIDQIAVALAYATKGAQYRKLAIEYFEKSINKVSKLELARFVVTSPYSIYTKFSTLYEREHEWDTAILWLRKASRYTNNKTYCKKHYRELEEKKVRNPKRRKRKISEEQIENERKLYNAAKYFIEIYGL